ncbi:MAG TPA: hypothetical protein VIY10_10175 [Solirubrobacteraceae bacterium]
MTATRAPWLPLSRAAAAMLIAAVACAVLLLGAGPARAGTWMQVSCVNPDGSAAPSDGWSGFAQGQVTIGDGNNTRCAPGVPLAAELGNQAVAVNGQSQVLQFTPPAGSTLIGGTLNVHLSAYGGHNEAAAAQADILEPQDTIDAGDAVLLCVDQSGCGSANAANATFTGTVTLPATRGGNLYVTAICTALSGSNCDENVEGNDGFWALAQITSAHLLLSNPAAPQGAAFSGSALQRNARGLAHVVFTATDPGGPGIYSVTAAVDGTPVFSGTPNPNGGACVPVGTDASGALMFDSAQPCPATEVVDVPIPTAGLADGSHELALTVTDAAGNGSTVLDQSITTSNPKATPVPRGRRTPRAQFVISWRWNGARTLLRTITVHRLPRHGHIAVRCTGRRCPKLELRSVTIGHRARLLRELTGRRFAAGNRLSITVSAPHLAPERIQLQIRSGRVPQGRLLRP